MLFSFERFQPVVKLSCVIIREKDIKIHTEGEMTRSYLYVSSADFPTLSLLGVIWRILGD